MSDSKKTDKKLTPGAALTAAGLGLILAPFTGGASLIYSAATIGTYAAIDAASDKQSADK